MTIILVRHGAYLPKNIDPKEGLSEDGKQEVEALLKKLKEKNITFQYVFSSPKTRALQTAKRLAKNITINTLDLLKPSTNPKLLFDYLQTIDEDTLFVSHNPLLSNLSSYFNFPILLQTAGCLVVEQEDQTFSL